MHMLQTITKVFSTKPPNAVKHNWILTEKDGMIQVFLCSNININRGLLLLSQPRLLTLLFLVAFDSSIIHFRSLAVGSVRVLTVIRHLYVTLVCLTSCSHEHCRTLNAVHVFNVALYPNILTPAFVACSTNAGKYCKQGEKAWVHGYFQWLLLFAVCSQPT